MQNCESATQLPCRSTWNLYHCSVDAAILNNTAKSIVDSGLSKVGYLYVNSDDCWMNAARDQNGNQVANPAKFPQGFKAVADYIHSLGLKSGLYTAKGSRTCAGFAASCQHEVQDAAQWASWGIARTRQPPPNHAGATLRPR